MNPHTEKTWWYFWRMADAGSISARTGQRPSARETFLLYREVGRIGNVLEVCAPVEGVNSPHAKNQSRRTNGRDDPKGSYELICQLERII